MDRFSKRFGGLWVSPLRLLLVVAVWAPLAAAVVAAFFLARLSDHIPETPDLESLRPTYASSVTTRTGWRLAGSQASRPVELFDLQPETIAAFLAAEDAEFFEHEAFNPKSIIRAGLANLRAGDSVQGASTITQQLAKRFLSPEKTLRRKVTELLMARRIEANVSKPDILETYLNASYFGQRAWGISQASWTYFAKPAASLGVGEAALLAGILPAPSAFNPHADRNRAKRERDQVLRRMGELGLLSKQRVEAEVSKPIVIAAENDVQPERMPYAAASAIRRLERHFDDAAWSEGGYTVVVPHSPVRQARARRSLRRGIEALDARQGWRGRLGRAVDADSVDQRLESQDADADFVLARIERIEPNEVTMITVGGEQRLVLDDAQWAAPDERERHYKRPAKLEDFREIFEADDLITVRRIAVEDPAVEDPAVEDPAVEDPPSDPEQPTRWQLVQSPSYEGAFMVIDSATGSLWASVGGFDADRSIFHRAEQGCRQPGSVFKPIVYSEALSQQLTPATMLSDLPQKFATGRGTVWQPKNADRDFKGFVMLADALAWSRNIPTVHLMDYLGHTSVIERAKKLGITSELDTTSSVALGASCVRPVEMARVFAAFQRRGKVAEVSSVGYIVDAQGDVLVDHDHFSVPDWSSAARLDRMAHVEPGPENGVSEQVAFIITRLLRRVVTSGTAHDLPNEWQVAGKTGTTNAYDGWFVGFDGDLTAVTWVGSDKNERALGRGEHGATVAMPVFEEFYGDYLAEEPDSSGPGFWHQEPPERVILRDIDPQTGLRSRPGEPGVELPFIQGTAPTEFAPTRGTRQAEQVDSLIHDF
jgi:penicillin-binding protein 1A